MLCLYVKNIFENILEKVQVQLEICMCVCVCVCRYKYIHSMCLYAYLNTSVLEHYCKYTYIHIFYPSLILKYLGSCSSDL